LLLELQQANRIAQAELQPLILGVVLRRGDLQGLGRLTHGVAVDRTVDPEHLGPELWQVTTVDRQLSKAEALGPGREWASRRG